MPSSTSLTPYHRAPSSSSRTRTTPHVLADHNLRTVQKSHHEDQHFSESWSIPESLVTEDQRFSGEWDFPESMMTHYEFTAPEVHSNLLSEPLVSCCAYVALTSPHCRLS